MSASAGHPNFEDFLQCLREFVGLLVADCGQSDDLIITVQLIDAVPLKSKKNS